MRQTDRHAVRSGLPAQEHSLKTLRAFSQILRCVQASFGWVFWRLGQRIARLADAIEQRRT